MQLSLCMSLLYLLKMLPVSVMSFSFYTYLLSTIFRTYYYANSMQCHKLVNVALQLAVLANKGS